MNLFSLPFVSPGFYKLQAIFVTEEELKQYDKYISPSLAKYLCDLKSQIDNYVNDWDIYKRITNPYEQIHSSGNGNYNRNVCKLKPLSRSFYKMIEIVQSMNLFRNMDTKINTFHLAEGPGGFIEATAYMRQCPDDVYYGMTLIDESINAPGWKKAEYFLKQNPNVHIVYGDDEKSNGDLLNRRNLLGCCGKYGSKMDFITGDGGFDFSGDFNRQEHMAVKLLFAQIIYAISLQKKGGCFVVKVFDVFTRVTSEMLFLLSIVYDRVSIIKPNTSRHANSERYVVCKGFRPLDGRKEWTIQLIEIFEQMIEQDNFLISIFKENIPSFYFNKLEEINTVIGQQQIDNISITLGLIRNPKPDKIETKRKANLQKCIQWCMRFNMPIDADNKCGNIFLGKSRTKDMTISRSEGAYCLRKNDNSDEEMTDDTCINGQDSKNLDHEIIIPDRYTNEIIQPIPRKKAEKMAIYEMVSDENIE